MTVERKHTAKRYSEINIHNGTVYLAGQLADDMTADIHEQTRQTLAYIDRMLEEAGSDKSKILSMTIFLKDIDAHYDAFNAVYDEWIPDGAAPGRACVQARMARPEALVEICIVAAL